MTARYFHGGAPDLRVGERILPPSVTGAPSCADWGAAGVCRRDRIYLGAGPAIAVIYAAMHHSERGGLYEVDADPPVEPDLDWTGEPGMSVQAPAATIVRVLDPESVITDGSVAELRRHLLAGIGSEPRRVARIGRNEPCLCGSGVKYKRCCGAARRVGASA